MKWNSKVKISLKIFVRNLKIRDFVCICIYIYIYIYIYIFTNLISTSIHGTRKKTKKTPPGTRDKSISNHQPEEKEKIIGQKERKGQPRLTPWKKSRDTQSVVKRKLKTFRESCNATITKVLNTSGANYKINLFKLILYIYIYTLTENRVTTPWVRVSIYSRLNMLLK